MAWALKLRFWRAGALISSHGALRRGLSGTRLTPRSGYTGLLDKVGGRWDEQQPARCERHRETNSVSDLVRLEDRCKRLTSRERRRARVLLIERDGEGCACCGSTGFLIIDHSHPIALGGTNDLSNLWLLCGPCDEVKTDGDMQRIRWERN